MLSGLSFFLSSPFQFVNQYSNCKNKAFKGLMFFCLLGNETTDIFDCIRWFLCMVWYINAEMSEWKYVYNFLLWFTVDIWEYVTSFDSLTKVFVVQRWIGCCPHPLLFVVWNKIIFFSLVFLFDCRPNKVDFISCYFPHSLLLD